MGRAIRGALAVMFLLMLVAVVACGGGGASAPDRPADQASAPAPQPTPEPTPEPTRGPDPGATTARVDAPPAPPAPVPAPEPTPASKPAPPAPKSVIQDPGGPVEVASTVAGVARIGAEKCKVCHKVQYESWGGSGHAKRTPSLDCEGCHGPGSAYKTMAVMKDPAKARDAGLVMPAKEFCATCHKSGWTDAMLTAVHAHKPA